MQKSTFIKKSFKKLLTKRKNCGRMVERLRNKHINGPLVKRLRHGPLKAETGVRFSHESPNKTYPNYFVSRDWFGFVFYLDFSSNCI